MKNFVDFIAFFWFLLSFALFSVMLRSNQRQKGKARLRQVTPIATIPSCWN